MNKILVASAIALLLAGPSISVAADMRVGIEGFHAIPKVDKGDEGDRKMMPALFAEIQHQKAFVPNLRLKHYKYGDDDVEYTAQDITLFHTVEFPFFRGSKVGAGLTRISGVEVFGMSGDDEYAPHIYAHFIQQNEYSVKFFSEAKVMRNGKMNSYDVTLGLRYDHMLGDNTLGMYAGYRQESMVMDGVFFDERVKSSSRGLFLGTDFRF